MYILYGDFVFMTYEGMKEQQFWSKSINHTSFCLLARQSMHVDQEPFLASPRLDLWDL